MTEKQSYFEFQDGKPVGINIYANNMAKKDFVYNINKNVIEKNERFFAYLDIIDAQRIVKELNILYKENQQLKAQLLYDGEDVCDICKHMYLISKGDYFIGKCKKGHKECSKEDISYCNEFEVKEY